MTKPFHTRRNPMPVLAFFTGKLTKEQYDVLRREVDREQKYPAGNVFHAASFDDAGNVHVADVWESAEELNAFAQTTLMPAFAKHNIAPPTVSVFPAHKVIAYAGVDKYRI
jgi:hypothetical protein